MFSNIALSIATIAVITASVISIVNKKIEIETQKLQAKQALSYEQREKDLKSTNYAKLDVKAPTLFIAKNEKDKVLLKKLEKAIKKVITQNPNSNNFSCNTLARTGQITLNECNEINNKKFAVILPSNNGVEQSVNNNIAPIKNTETKKSVIPVVANTITTNSNQIQNIVKNSDNTKTFQTPQETIANVNKIVKFEEKKLKITDEIIKHKQKIPTTIATNMLNTLAQKRQAIENSIERARNTQTQNINTNYHIPFYNPLFSQNNANTNTNNNINRFPIFFHR